MRNLHVVDGDFAAAMSAIDRDQQNNMRLLLEARGHETCPAPPRSVATPSFFQARGPRAEGACRARGVYNCLLIV